MRTLTIINFITSIVNWKTRSRRYLAYNSVSVIEQLMAANRLCLDMDKTELMWTGYKHNVSKIPVCCHSLTLSGIDVKNVQKSVAGQVF